LRAVKISKYLPEFGWQPVILTYTPKSYYAKDDFLLSEITSPGIKISRTTGPRRNLLNENLIDRLPNEGKRRFFRNICKFMKIPDKEIKWKKKALKLASQIIETEKIDLIFATAPPFTSLLLGYELKQRYGIKLVIDYRSSWLHASTSFFPTPYHRFKNRKMEQEVLRVADEVITINRRIKEYLIQEYPNVRHDDILIVPHGFDQADFDAANVQLPRTSKMRFTYAGYFFDLCSPKKFLEALSVVFKKHAELKRKIEACFLGVLSKEILTLIQKLQLGEAVYNPGYVNHFECIKYLSASDVLWLGINNDDGADIVSTVKLSEYFGARKPILAYIPDGVAKQSLRHYEAVKICEPDNLQQIADLIIEYYDLFRTNRMPLPNDEIIKKYDIKMLANQLAREFEFLLDITTQATVTGRKFSVIEE
jgi:glycosyltransferase involved in cell wall biosynthesis